MARFEITAPVSDFSGVVNGIVFTDGSATVESTHDNPALARLVGNGFTVVDLDAKPEPPTEMPIQPEAEKPKAATATTRAKPSPPRVPADGRDTPIGD